MKIKSINPSLREKKRYLAYEILTRRPIGKDMSHPIANRVKETLGLFDSAEAGIMHMKYDIKNQRGIIKVNTKYTDKLRVALMLMNAEDLGMDAAVHTLGVSGTLQKLGRAS